jgi:hypothetical protein
MMNYFRYEAIKIFSHPVWIITAVIAVAIWSAISFITGLGLAPIGLDATPETHPQLMSALPPLEYLGFDLATLGQIPMAILGAAIGAAVFRNHELRTAFLSMNDRRKYFLFKMLVLTMGSACLSFVAMYFSIAAHHIGWGEAGLSPITLSPVTWVYIAWGTLNLVLVTLWAFGLSMLFRNMILPLIILIPQIVGFGYATAFGWDLYRFIPLQFAPYYFNPVIYSVVLGLLVMVFLIASAMRLIHQDVGGKY